MGIYVIGDIHGCYTQFTELRERIENNDADAVFILAGDIVGRGPEDEKILSWAYENITLNGKYQMVLGNHDDGFMEVFGNGDFETIYSLGEKAGHHYHAPSDEFRHLRKNKDQWVGIQHYEEKLCWGGTRKPCRLQP
ncbi:MAG: metallophosphoesterase [Treponema sp.]|nr:metallophosphoesterase [Treponema sp.]